LHLGSIARARGVRLLSLDEIDSSNDEARRLIEAGERGPLWVFAARQTKGRGRLGRQWISPAGNFHASLVFSDFPEFRVAPQLGFVTGVAAIRALRGCAGEGAFQLKWPNDLLLEGEKLGGILLECVNAALGPVAIIGIGVNILAAPSDTPYPARALSSIGPGALSREALLERLSDSLVEALDLWRGGEGFHRIREEWLGSTAGLGQDIRVVLGNEAIKGRFETIDACGRLVIETSAGRRIIEAGDVLIGPRATIGAPV
jgi:biotin-[acetyl-CoA-carboxylase] ligase BirA-like protein